MKINAVIRLVKQSVLGVQVRGYECKEGKGKERKDRRNEEKGGVQWAMGGAAG